MSYIEDFRNLNELKRESQLKMRLQNNDLLYILCGAAKEFIPNTFDIVYNQNAQKLTQSKIKEIIKDEKESGRREEILLSRTIDQTKNSGEKAMPLARETFTKYCYEKGINPEKITMTYIDTRYKTLNGNKFINRESPKFSQQVIVFIRHKELGAPDTGRMVQFKNYKRK